MESSYREKLGNLQFTNEEIGVVLKSTVTLLRRHNVDGTLCPRCGNDDQAACSVTKIDDVGFITEVKCESCTRPDSKLSAICRNARCRYELVEDPSILRAGDHVSWHRPYLIWHHAVVVRQDRSAEEITIHEYTLSNDGPYAAIVETTMSYEESTSLKKGTLYRVVYDDSYPDQYVMLRSMKSFGERKYDVFEQNCEHSTHWCKTGIHEGTQMEACFTTAGKAALVVFLRLISLIILWLLQLSEPQDGGSRKQERVISVVYMAAIGCLFFIYSLSNSCREIRPKVAIEPHATDICGIEAARRGCADVTHRYCCCGVQKCNAVVLALCCASCFFCSLFDACCSGCRKNIQCGGTAICRRPPSIVIGLFLRILIRETIAAAGPVLVVCFEDEIASQFATLVNKFVVIILAIVGASLVSYLVGALIGVWIEALLICCATCCCGPESRRPGYHYEGVNQQENAQVRKEQVELPNEANDQE